MSTLAGKSAYVFFFSSRRRHTRLQGDWSSDVCSSDLYDEAYGARPLKRLIQKEVENALARRVLGNEFGDGDASTVDNVDDRLSCERHTPVVSEATAGSCSAGNTGLR